ncbi:uncharacterized protein [Coffea arabica]|uniref:Uncharacterized protein isoform X2 n=1 Tax=Coffea arabica TaxID=13443 RepID=A0ABM4WXY0_COFAR
MEQELHSAKMWNDLRLKKIFLASVCALLLNFNGGIQVQKLLLSLSSDQEKWTPAKRLSRSLVSGSYRQIQVFFCFWFLCTGLFNFFFRYLLCSCMLTVDSQKAIYEMSQILTRSSESMKGKWW